MRNFEYRLYPNKRQKTLLMKCLAETRGIYNEMLQACNDRYAKEGKFYFENELSKMFKGRGIVAQSSTIQCLARRLDRSFHTYFSRKKKGLKAGFPRFKTPNQWHSFQLRQWNKNFRLEGSRLVIPYSLGRSIKIKLHRPIEGQLRTCYMVLRGDGNWYAILCCTGKPPEDEKVVGEELGLDVGLEKFCTDSDGGKIPNPRYFKNSHKILRRKQRRSSRRIKGSVRKKKAARIVSKFHLKISRQRKDFHNKEAKKYIDKCKLIAVEDLNIEGMVKNKLFSKSIADVGWGQFLTILAEKAESAGCKFVRVPCYHTSQKCSSCGIIVRKDISVRIHSCPECGYVADRDVNAARNILARAKDGLHPSGTLDIGRVVELRSLLLT